MASVARRSLRPWWDKDKDCDNCNKFKTMPDAKLVKMDFEKENERNILRIYLGC